MTATFLIYEVIITLLFFLKATIYINHTKEIQTNPETRKQDDYIAYFDAKG